MGDQKENKFNDDNIFKIDDDDTHISLDINSNPNPIKSSSSVQY